MNVATDKHVQNDHLTNIVSSKRILFSKTYHAFHENETTQL